MKNIIKIYLTVFLIAFSIFSCTDADLIVNEVLDNVESGAVLRGDDDTLIDNIVLDVTPALFYIDLQEQDREEGALLESVDVFVTYRDNSTLAGDSAGANTAEVAVMTMSASDFSPGEFGLPAASLSLPLTQLLSVVGLADDTKVYVLDTFTIRLALNLTDGRTFTDTSTTGNITGGFFNSPFLYVVPIEGGMDLVFTEEGTNEINIGDGAVNAGYSADVEIIEVEDGLFTSMEVYAKFSDVNGEAPDFSTAEALIGTFDRNTFGPSEDGNLIRTVSFTLAEISGGVDITDMNVNDFVDIRYSLINHSGRAISTPNAPFVQKVPVVSCPVPPLVDPGTFVGDYELEHVITGIFGYNTFGEGEVVTVYSGVTDASQNSPGVTLATTHRSFDASYLFDLGSGLYHTYIVNFGCTSVTPIAGAGPIGDFTGWTCSGLSLLIGEQIGGGSFDATNDSEFTMGFLDDIFDDCGGGPVFGAIKFIKQ